MKLLILTGPPGVGKGTQASLLKDRLGAIHISTGALLRSEVQSGSDLGKRVDSVMSSGNLVSDEIIFLCLESVLADSEKFAGKLIVLDGVPRNVKQVRLLDDCLSRLGVKVDLAVALVAPVEELVNRFSKRWTCNSCGTVFALETAPAFDLECPNCGKVGSITRRSDDEPEAVRHRFLVYFSSTQPVLDAYSTRGVLRQVNGLLSQEEVFEEVRSEVARIL